MEQYKQAIELLREREFEKARKAQTVQERKEHLKMADAYTICLEVLRGSITVESIRKSKI